MAGNDWRNRIRAWHYGKLVILWIWGAALMGLAYFLIIDLEPGDGGALLLGFAAIAVLAAVPIALSALTWMWLSGKEKPEAE